MGRLKIAHSAVNDSGFNGSYGIVGGNTNISTPSIQCRVKIGANAEANGWIIRQKGKRKFLVSDGTNTGVCMLANLANAALTANTMTITVTKLDTSTVRLQYLTNKHGVDFTGAQYMLSFGSAAVAPAGSRYPIVTVASA